MAIPVASIALEGDLDQHNEGVKQELLDYLLEMHPRQVELLIGKLLGSLGFEDVEVTRYVGDSGIDIDATLTLGGVTSVRTAVQVKRYKSNIAGDLVRQLRGSLQADQRGLIMTTGGFTRDARTEASATGKTPISLVDGARLVDLLVQQQIGVARKAVSLLTLQLDELVTAETPESHGKALSLWPLPGGVSQYFETLLVWLDHIASTRPQFDDFTAWVIETYEKVTSRGVVTSYVRTVLHGLRLVRFDEDRLLLTEQGESIRASKSAADLVTLLENRVVGVTEMLSWLREEPLSVDEILKRLRDRLGVSWETETQVRYRLEWLAAAGCIQRQGEVWAAVGATGGGLA